MIARNIKLVIRNILKNKITTGINLIRITVGITISMFIFLYTQKELTTDSNIANRDEIYALLVNESPYVSQKMINLFKDKIPEIKHLTYFSDEWAPQVFLSKNNDKYKVENLLVADSAFFRVFQFEPLWGNPMDAISSSNKIVLNETMSKKIFGNVNPVGKSLTYNSTYLQNELVTVGAVVKDLPHNSSWTFDAIISMQTNYKIGWYANNLKHWDVNCFSLFFSLNKNVDILTIKEKLESLKKTDFPEGSKNREFSIIPYTDVYFDSPEYEDLNHGNSFTVGIIQTTGILILILACINYINLITAQKEKRNKIISIFKTLGSSKKKIMGLVITESSLLLFLVLILSIFLLELLLGTFNQLTNSQFTLTSFFTGWNLLIFAGVFLLTLVITGLIPALIFSSRKTDLLQKGVRSYKSHLRNGLLVFQFTISIILLSSIIFIFKQNDFLTNTSTGFKKDNIIYLSTNKDIEKNIQAFKNGLHEISGVSDLTFSECAIGNVDQGWGMKLLNKGVESKIQFRKMNVSPNFFDFFGIELVQGSKFLKSSRQNNDMIFNETAIKKHNINQINNARVVINENTEHGNIIGVVKDFNFESMHKPLRNAGYLCSDECDEFVYIKINQSNLAGTQQTIKSIEKLWNTLSPKFPFEYQFLNKSWSSLYKKDKQFQRILSYATITSLFLSCLGLIGLTFFIIENKIKEIGVRKVNGAKTHEIVKMLNKTFIKWVVIAFLIACPIAWYSISKWLENFAYKINLNWWGFAFAGLVAICIVLITVSWQSWRAANRNPVDALRYE